MTSRTGQLATAVTVQQLFGYAQDRVCITLNHHSAAHIFVGPDASLTALNGLEIAPNNPTQFALSDGYSVNEPMYVIADGGTDSITYRIDIKETE